MSVITETEIKSMTKEQNYMQGYKDGKNDVLDNMRAEIFNACSDIYHMPVYKLSCDEICEIIDKYMAESEEV